MAKTSLNMRTQAAEKKPRKTYLFRIYPSRKQRQKLEAWLGLCCEVYNAALDERQSAYRIAGISLSYEHQCAELPACKQVYPALNEVLSQVLQDVVKRVDRAFDGFFRRVKEGQKPGYPRFKSRFRYDSLTFKQYGNSFSIVPASKKSKATLVLAKVGHVKMVRHRAIKGTPKTAIVKRTPTGKWFVSISVELQEEEIISKLLPVSEEAVGIDVGLNTFAYLSCGEGIANPRFLRAEEAALARVGRKLSKAPKGSKQRAKKRKVVARVHERIRNRRKNFIEQEVCQLIKRFGLVAVEALVVRSMMKHPKLVKSIADASWSMFFTRLQAKAEEAGRQVVRVNPAYTSQTCSACGHRQQMPLCVRVYECPQCSLVIHRDHNGSLNILANGLQAVGRHSRVIPEAPGL
ncbi:transposase [Ktedonobacter sp. SOSP1-52]|uniref:RNA-guided endonuclease InsQ/TnpB family protein n=1 Tax=Ktedonobacter sp. SOSP1-52 TaxID=2778366 RepID=UPI001A2F232C|nr:transposase [Ktedonobacter sp. SOSP1-52]GHO66788.1 transposase [Ktedonobacter sp. SOSP1-52]